MPLSPGIAEWLRSEGHEAAHAGDLGLHSSADVDILRHAHAHGAVVVTADLDFTRLLAAAGSDGPGLILLRGGNYTEAESLGCIKRVLLAIPTDELPRCIVVVDREGIRRRWLPI